MSPATDPCGNIIHVQSTTTKIDRTTCVAGAELVLWDFIFCID